MKNLNVLGSTKYLLAALFAIFYLSGCAENIRQPSSMADHEAALRNAPMDVYSTPAVKSEGSLFSDDARMDMFSDLKARRVGDIITVNIVETSKASKNAQTNTGRNNRMNASIDALAGYENTDNVPVVGSVFGSLGLNMSTGLNASYSSKFNGSGTTSRNENMTAKVSARVLQVLPNGNLIIRGTQEMLVNNEKHYIDVQGVVRPADIDANNTVLSTYMADARIDYRGEGDVSRKQREGWLSRLLDVIWPF